MTGPYLVQTVHVRGRQPRLLREHLDRLERSRAELFGEHPHLDAKEVAERIVRLLDAERYPAGLSIGVRLELRGCDTLDLRPDPVPLYRGYVLRALRPAACSLRFDVPFSPHPTSAGEAVWATAGEIAAARGYRTAVRIDRSGLRSEADGAPLFTVRGRTVFVPAPPADVTGRLAAEAIRRAGYALRIETTPAEELPFPDELFYVDHRGVTALESCDGRLLMAVIAERVAGEMERIWEKP